MASPASVQDELAPSSSAAARRARKRESDRRCQRLARERTKNRITYLEGLVDDLKKHNTTDQVQSLLKQRDDIAAERDALTQTIRAIERVMRDNNVLLAGKPSEETIERFGTDASKEDTKSPGSSNAGINIQSPYAELVSIDQDNQTTLADTWVETPSADLITSHAITSSSAYDAMTLDTPFVPSLVSTPPFDDSAWTHEDPIVPDAPGCECSVVDDANDIRGRNGGINLWRYANKTLTEPVEWTPEISAWEDEIEVDIPVRAILEGWDAVKQRVGGQLPASWDIFRRLDEKLLNKCGAPERLATLRAMHALYRCHKDPARVVGLPYWSLARPSQSIAHSYAIDFFPWPGVRERFVFQQHRYCSNQFWYLFAANVRVLWPFEFRDCYSRNLQTGDYTVSPVFQERLRDLKCWSMKKGMFEVWPELMSDIVVFDSVPAQVPNVSTPKRIQAPPRQWSQHAASPVPVNAADDCEVEGSHRGSQRRLHQQAQRRSMANLFPDFAPSQQPQPIDQFQGVYFAPPIAREYAAYPT